eukprot:symbB.v1.2.026391.t1/scaffold2559.1/size125745/10
MFCCCSGEDGTLAEVDAKPAVDEVGQASTEMMVELPFVGDLEVRLQARPGGDLGIELDLIDSKGPVITGISEALTILKADRDVKVFDRIKSVNGKTGTATELYDMLRSKDQEIWTLQLTRPKERHVTVPKYGKPLGAQMDFKDDSLGIVVTEVQSGGVLSQWNAEHPTESIDVGDRIVKLSGEELQGMKLIQKIKEEKVLHFTILRY